MNAPAAQQPSDSTGHTAVLESRDKSLYKASLYPPLAGVAAAAEGGVGGHGGACAGADACGGAVGRMPPSDWLGKSGLTSLRRSHSAQRASVLLKFVAGDSCGNCTALDSVVMGGTCLSATSCYVKQTGAALFAGGHALLPHEVLLRVTSNLNGRACRDIVCRDASPIALRNTEHHQNIPSATEAQRVVGIRTLNRRMRAMTCLTRLRSDLKRLGSVNNLSLACLAKRLKPRHESTVLIFSP